VTTRLRYLEEMDRLELQARVFGVDRQEDRDVLILEETVFYPQGGGQPFDQGTILSHHATFTVDEVRYADGLVRHLGKLEGGSITEGESVTCQVDPVRRRLHSRVHSAGHVVDMAVTAMGLEWVPGKGYHFPEGPYVEYSGSLEGLDTEALKADIGQRCESIVRAGIETRVRFVTPEEMRQLCRFVPDYLPAGKPARIVLYGDFGVPCGGTHVSRLADIGPIIIRKIKQNRDVVRVSYGVGA
jgi:Ser-tRNA(Ala) deacylase AlaX